MRFPRQEYWSRLPFPSLPYKGGIETRRDSLVAQMIENLPAMQDTWIQSLGRKDPLEKEMATHSSILAWAIPWIEVPGGLQHD